MTGAGRAQKVDRGKLGWRGRNRTRQGVKGTQREVKVEKERREQEGCKGCTRIS